MFLRRHKLHFTEQKFQFQTLHCPFTKQFCYTPCTLRCSLVSEWVPQAYPHFLVWIKNNKVLNFLETAMIIQVFHLLIHWIAEKLAIFFHFCQLSPQKVRGGSLKSKHPLCHTIPCNIFLHPKACLLVLCFSGGWNEYMRRTPSLKTPICLIPITSASSVSSIMQDILPRMLKELELEGKKGFP